MEDKLKAWLRPQMTVYGTLAEITSEKPKRFGFSDDMHLSAGAAG